jgi:hypothetical protein
MIRQALIIWDTENIPMWLPAKDLRGFYLPGDHISAMSCDRLIGKNPKA